MTSVSDNQDPDGGWWTVGVVGDPLHYRDTAPFPLVGGWGLLGDGACQYHCFEQMSSL